MWSGIAPDLRYRLVCRAGWRAVMPSSRPEGDLITGEPQLGEPVAGDDLPRDVVGSTVGRFARMPSQNDGGSDDQVIVRHWLTLPRYDACAQDLRGAPGEMPPPLAD